MLTFFKQFKNSSNQNTGKHYEHELSNFEIKF